MKIFTIKPNRTGKVRTTLYLEDIEFENMNTLLGFGLVRYETYNDEEFLVFKEAIGIPKFNKFYASRIKGFDDPYLTEVCKMLLYLNPNPDKLLRKKICEFIVLRFSQLEMRPSNIKSTEMVSMPVLTFEMVEAALSIVYVTEDNAEKKYYPKTGVFILFSKNSKYSKGDKISIHAQSRSQAIVGHLSSAIHIAAEHLIDTQEFMKITNTKIEDTKLVRTHRGVASLRMIAKYMKDDTKEIIADHNAAAPFPTTRTMKKYKEFLAIEEGKSLSEITTALSISKSTAVEFKNLKDIFNYL